MVTKKASVKKSTKVAKPVRADATPREVIEKYDSLRLHVKILTVLSGLVLLAVILLGIILIKCDDCKPTTNKVDSSSKLEKPERPEAPEEIETDEE